MTSSRIVFDSYSRAGTFDDVEVFMELLSKHFTKRGDVPPHEISGQSPHYQRAPISLFKLWNVVQSLGGSQSVQHGRKWAQVGRAGHFGTPGTNSSNMASAMRRLFQKYLTSFEKEVIAGGGAPHMCAHRAECGGNNDAAVAAPALGSQRRKRKHGRKASHPVTTSVEKDTARRRSRLPSKLLQEDYVSGTDVQTRPSLRTTHINHIATAARNVPTPPLLPQQRQRKSRLEDQKHLLCDDQAAATTLSRLSASGSPPSGQQTSAVCASLASLAGPDGSEQGPYTEAVQALPMRPLPGAASELPIHALQDRRIAVFWPHQAAFVDACVIKTYPGRDLCEIKYQHNSQDDILNLRHVTWRLLPETSETPASNSLTYSSQAQEAEARQADVVRDLQSRLQEAQAATRHYQTVAAQAAWVTNEALREMSDLRQMVPASALPPPQLSPESHPQQTLPGPSAQAD